MKIKDRPFFAVKIPYAPGALLAAIDQQGIDALLIADGLAAESETIAKLARSKHVLTAANAVSYVEKDLTLCVTELGGDIKIIINLNAAHLEGIRFSSRLSTPGNDHSLTGRAAAPSSRKHSTSRSLRARAIAAASIRPCYAPGGRTIGVYGGWTETA